MPTHRFRRISTAEIASRTARLLKQTIHCNSDKLRRKQESPRKPSGANKKAYGETGRTPFPHTHMPSHIRPCFYVSRHVSLRRLFHSPLLSSSSSGKLVSIRYSCASFSAQERGGGDHRPPSPSLNRKPSTPHVRRTPSGNAHPHSSLAPLSRASRLLFTH